MNVSELQTHDYALGETILEVGNMGNGYTVIEWNDGWTFRFPSDLPVDDMGEYIAQNAG